MLVKSSLWASHDYPQRRRQLSAGEGAINLHKLQPGNLPHQTPLPPPTDTTTTTRPTFPGLTDNAAPSSTAPRRTSGGETLISSFLTIERLFLPITPLPFFSFCRQALDSRCIDFRHLKHTQRDPELLSSLGFARRTARLISVCFLRGPCCEQVAQKGLPIIQRRKKQTTPRFFSLHVRSTLLRGRTETI